MANVQAGYIFTGPTDSLTFAKLNLLGTPTVTIGTGEIVTANLADNSVTLAKLPLVASGTMLGRKSLLTGDVEVLAWNSTLITQPTGGFVLADGLNNQHIIMGQSLTAYVDLVWNFNVTEASTGFTINCNPGGAGAVINLTASSVTMGGISAGINGSVLAGGGSLATTATNGFLYIPKCAGTPTGVPAFTPSGGTDFIPMVFDTSGVKIWFYTGGAWKGVVVA